MHYVVYTEEETTRCLSRGSAHSLPPVVIALNFSRMLAVRGCDAGTDRWIVWEW